MKTAAWALLALASVSAFAQVNPQSGSAQQSTTLDPCAVFLPDYPSDYEECKDGQLEALGISCEIASFVPGLGITWTTTRFTGRAFCPDNGLTEARQQLASFAAQQARRADCNASPHMQWQYDTCVRVSCPNGKVVVGQSCQCPAGTVESGRNRQCRDVTPTPPPPPPPAPDYDDEDGEDFDDNPDDYGDDFPVPEEPEPREPDIEIEECGISECEDL